VSASISRLSAADDLQRSLTVDRAQGSFMSRTTFLASHAFLACAAVSHADVVTLDFNALKIGEEVLDSYDGGFGSLGSGPGPNIGITFSNDFVTMAGGVFGPPFRAEELTSTRGILDIPAGYSGIFSFYFKNSGAFGNVIFCPGLDAAGCTLGQLELSPLPTFGAAGLLLTVPAHSVVIFGMRMRWSSTTSRKGPSCLLRVLPFLSPLLLFS